MKVLKVSVGEYYSYYLYPQGINCIEEFIAYANKNYNSLIALTVLKEDDNCYPYFIEENKKAVYINVANILDISEDEVEVLPKKEYNERLEKLVKKMCTECQKQCAYKLDNDLKWCKRYIVLDGKCRMRDGY